MSNMQYRNSLNDTFFSTPHEAARDFGMHYCTNDGLRNYTDEDGNTKVLRRIVLTGLDFLIQSVIYLTPINNNSIDNPDDMILHLAGDRDTQVTPWQHILYFFPGKLRFSQRQVRPRETLVCIIVQMLTKQATLTIAATRKFCIVLY